ncbi:MAG: hypothetical protein V3V06_07500 [Dehalococcoidia bacterium]
MRRRFFAAMREAIATNGGDEITTIGDNIVVAFTQSAADAVSGAGPIQRVARRTEHDPSLVQECAA